MPVMNYLNQCIFDHGAIGQLGKTLKEQGVARPFIVTDQGIKAAGLLETLLGALGMDPAHIFDETVPNPTETQAMQAAALYKESGADGIVALGGGSSMDNAKMIGLLASHDGPCEQYAGMVGGARLIGKLPPLIAVPTTSGTGSEVSVGAILIMENGRKETFVSPNLIPTVAICDPDLTLGLPAHLTAATGMDAVTHCIEAVLTPAINPPAESIRPLVDWLDYNGFTMITKPTKEFVDATGRRKIKGNMDIELAVDVMHLAQHLDHIVILSGDGDFRYLVQAVQSMGKRVTVVSTLKTKPPMIADDLRRQADTFVDLMDLRDKIGRAGQRPPQQQRNEPVEYGDDDDDDDYDDDEDIDQLRDI